MVQRLRCAISLKTKKKKKKTVKWRGNQWKWKPKFLRRQGICNLENKYSYILENSDIGTPPDYYMETILKEYFFFVRGTILYFRYTNISILLEKGKKEFFWTELALIIQVTNAKAGNKQCYLLAVSIGDFFSECPPILGWKMRNITIFRLN